MLFKIRKHENFLSLKGQPSNYTLTENDFHNFGKEDEGRYRGTLIRREMDWKIAARIVTVEKVKWAIQFFETNKTSGPDSIFPKML